MTNWESELPIWPSCTTRSFAVWVGVCCSVSDNTSKPTRASVIPEAIIFGSRPGPPGIPRPTTWPKKVNVPARILRSEDDCVSDSTGGATAATMAPMVWPASETPLLSAVEY